MHGPFQRASRYKKLPFCKCQFFIENQYEIIKKPVDKGFGVCYCINCLIQ